MNTLTPPLIETEAPVLPPAKREPVRSPTPAVAPAGRLQSLDAYRGLIMVTLAFNGFGLAATARNHLAAGGGPPGGGGGLAVDAGGGGFWNTVYHHFEHAEWAGGGYWDMIQPSFMFMVGVAMAFSYGKRQRLGQSHGQMLRHAMVRSLILILLGIGLAYWKNLAAFFGAKWADYRPWGLM